ncbi:hypothetical protein ACQPZX_30425 [Actinoplanes sp. CA-142083]|uniref:hypothetical protein n=1 Tax=Actinoplanes sp. CA-142083 TaxID=3239903 RepID=UPI003D93ABD1
MATYTTYAVAVWDGDRPGDDVAARAMFDTLYSQYVNRPYGEAPAPPTPRIDVYRQILLARYPQDAPDCPWSTRLANEVTGPLMYFVIKIEQYVKVSYFVAKVAADQGLVCFDLQWGKLRP